jgi:dUTP pyrophosphatase
MLLNFERIRDVKCPVKANPADAGIDFFIPDDFEETCLLPHNRALIPSGIKVNVPRGHVLVAFNKSGVSSKTGLTALACVVDSGYQGEVHISLVNSSEIPVMLKPGMKIIQFILLPIPEVKPNEVLSGTLFLSGLSNRGTGGFGSTGEY